MAAGVTDNLALVTGEEGDKLAEAVVKTNFEKIDQYVAATRMKNLSGSTRTAGDVVIRSTAEDRAFTTVGTIGSAHVIGVVQETIPDGEFGIVKHYGVTVVKVTGATLRGYFLRSSTTPGWAESALNTFPGAFARALTASASAGTVVALLFGAPVDHGNTAGLADDDHPQYLNTTRHNAIDAADHASGSAPNGQVLTADGTGGTDWQPAPGGALTLEAYSATESTNNSGTAVDLKSIVVDIPATTGFIVRGVFRTGSGEGTTDVLLGLKLNTTQVIANVAVTTVANAVRQGTFEFVVPPRVTNYLQSSMMHAFSHIQGTATVTETNSAASVNAPTATITAVVITGDSNLTTLAVDEVSVWTVEA